MSFHSNFQLYTSLAALNHPDGYDHHLHVFDAENTDVVALVPLNDMEAGIHEFDLMSKSVNIVPGLTYDDAIAMAKSPKQIVEGKPPLTFKNYRTVDISHVNKLHSLMDYPVTQTTLEGMPILQGMCVLPGAFVVANGINKTISPANFNLETGQKYLRKDLEAKADEKMWELEGYRLYRNLHTIDALCVQYDINERAVHMLANGADVFRSKLKDVVYLSTARAKFESVIITSDNVLNRCVEVVPYDAYLQIRTLLNTYLESN